MVYYRYMKGKQFWLFMVYSKGEMNDMNPDQKRLFKKVLTEEIRARTMIKTERN